MGDTIIRPQLNLTVSHVSIKTIATKFVGENPLRHFLHIQNINEDDVYISNDPNVTVGHGWLLNAPKEEKLQPGELELSMNRGNLTGEALYAVANNKAGRIMVVEFTRGDSSIITESESSSSSSST